MAAKVSSEKKAPTLGELEDQVKGKKGKNKGGKGGGSAKGKGNQKGQAGETGQAVVKSSGKGRTILVICLVWLLLLGTALVLVMFDPTEDSVIRGSVLLFLDPEGEAFEIYYQPELIELADRNREADARELELDLYEDELDTFASQLDDRELELDERESRIEEYLALFEESSGESSADLMARVVYYAKALTKMTPANAASDLEILYESDVDLCVKVCMEIGSSKIAPILDQMDREIRGELGISLVTEGVEDMSDKLAELEDLDELEE